MVKDNPTFLRQIALLESLKDNVLAQILSRNPDIDISSRANFFERIAPFYRSFSGDAPQTLSFSQSENEIDEWENLDLRIKNVRLGSIRGLPYQDDNLFGIDFTDENSNPQSMVILGANSVGKSTIYDALEYSFCQKIGEAQLRTSDVFPDGSNYYKEYLQHFDRPFDDATCTIELQCGKTFNISNENIPLSVRKKINPNSHFISDFDIYSNGKLNFTGNSNDSFQNLIANSIGLSELLQKEKQLFAFASYSRKIESTRKSNLEREIHNSEEIISKNSIAILEKKKAVQEFNSETPTVKVDNNDIQTLKLLNEIKSLSIEIDINENELQNAKKQYENLFDQSVALKDFKGKNQVDFLEEGLRLLEEQKSCPICNNSKLSPAEIKSHLAEKIENFTRFNKLSSDLSRATKLYIDQLSALSYGLSNIRGKITYEISNIRDNKNFHELSHFNNQFLSLLNELNSQDIFARIQAIQNDDLSVTARQNHLRELTYHQGEFLNEKLKYYLTEIQNLIPTRQRILREIENNIRIKPVVAAQQGEVAVLERDIKILQDQISMEEKNLSVKRPELVNAIETLELYQQIKKDTRVYANIFHKQLNHEIKSAFEPIQKIVKEILDRYLYIEGRPATLKIGMKPEAWDDETGEVISEIIIAYIEPLDKTQSPQEVNKYFNTFHYRLFCTMVGISIAVASRKNTGINLPLVLDDIFYASDFENRTTIEEFVTKLFELFNEFTPNSELQLILFTHDQLIFDSILRASTAKNFSNIVFAKLFKHEEAEKLDNYMNLIYRMPVASPYSTKQLINKNS